MKADDAPAERLHPISVLSGFGLALRQMIGGFAAGGFFAFQGRAGLALLIVGGLLLSIAVGMVLHWWRFSFRVGEDALRIDSGIVARNHRVIPFDRVADVSLTQGPLQRLFGVAKVTLETGGGSAMGGEEGVLGGVALQRAEALRDFVRARRVRPALSEGLAASAGPSEVTEGRTLFAMDPARVLKSGLFNFSLALFAGLFGISQTLGDALNVDPFEREFWEPLIVHSGLGDWLLAHRFGLAVGGLVLLVLAGILTGIIRTTLRDWGFALQRTGTGLRRQRGLLTRTDVTLPVRRVQAGVIDTGPVRERFGWYGFSVKSLAGDIGQAGKGGDHVLAPFALYPELEPVADELAWSLPDEATAWRPVSKAHLWSFLAMLVPLLLVLAVLGLGAALLSPDAGAQMGRIDADVIERARRGAVLGAGLLGGLLLVLTFLRWLEWKRTFYALEEDRLLIRTGWWKREIFLLPLRNVQTADILETGLSRLFGVAHVVVGVAGGSWAGHRVPSLARNEASQLRRELLSRQP